MLGTRCALLLGALAGALLVPVSSTAAPAVLGNVIVFTRTTNGPSVLRVDYSAGTDGRRSSALGYWSLDSRDELLDGGVSVTTGGYMAPETNASGAPIGCVTLPVKPAPICESRVGGANFGSFQIETSDSTGQQKLVLAFSGDPRLLNVKLAPSTRGWSLVRLARHVQLRRTQDTQGTYVLSASEGVEHFEGTSLRGSRRGSLAVAALPCRVFPGGITSGTGDARLEGGREPKPLGCPSGPVQAVSHARAGTTWTLSGQVLGVTASGIQVTGALGIVSSSSQDVRLMVVDGPF